MSTARKIISNTAVQVLGKVITAALGIISVKLITNYLSANGYGQYTAIYDYIALFAIIADFGLFTIAVREMAHNEKNVERIIGNVLSIRTFLAVISLGLGVVIAYILPQYRDTFIPFGVSIVAIATVLALVAGTVSSVLQVFLKMHYSALALVVGKIITVGYIVATIVVWFPNDPVNGFPHLLYSWIVGNLFALVLMYIPSRRIARIAYKFEWGFWKDVVLKALPYGLALILGSIYFRIGTVIMTLFGLIEAAGIYGVAMRFSEIMIIIPAFFMNSVLPVLTKSIKEKSEKVKTIIQYSFDFMALFTLPVVAGGFLLAPPLIAAISNENFVGTNGNPGSDLALRILLFAAMFTFFHAVFGFTLVALGKQSRLLWINLVTTILNVGLNMYLIPRFSFVGTAAVNVFSELFILISTGLLVLHYLRMKLNWSLFVKGLVAATVMVSVLYFVHPVLQTRLGLLSLLISVPLGMVIYAGFLYALGAFPKELLSLLKKPASLIDPLL